MSEPQLCKSLPSITIDRIEILPDPSVRISATVNGIESGLLKDSRLIDYIDFVCVVSGAQNESSEDQRIKELLDEGLGQDLVKLIDRDAPDFLLYRVKNLSEAYYETFFEGWELRLDRDPGLKVTFEFGSEDGDAQAKFQEFIWVAAGGVAEEYFEDLIDVIWIGNGGTSLNLSYFTYAIINTSKLAEDYGIIISDTYRTIMGQYTNGRILQNNQVESDFKDYAVIQDLREYRPPDGTKGCAAGSGE